MSINDTSKIIIDNSRVTLTDDSRGIICDRDMLMAQAIPWTTFWVVDGDTRNWFSVGNRIVGDFL